MILTRSAKALIILAACAFALVAVPRIATPVFAGRCQSVADLPALTSSGTAVQGGGQAFCTGGELITATVKLTKNGSAGASLTGTGELHPTIACTAGTQAQYFTTTTSEAGTVQSSTATINCS